MLYLKALAHPYHLLLYIHKMWPQSTKTHMSKTHVPLNIPLPCTLVQSPCMLTIAHLHMNITMRTPNITISHALNTYSPWCIPLRYLSLITTRASNSTILCTHSTYHSWHTPFPVLSTSTRSNSTIAHAHGSYYPWYTPFIHLSTTEMQSPNIKI